MHQKLRRGLLGTFFAGGLLALGATAANADTTVTGTVAVESESVSADVIASTSLGLLGGPTTSGSSEIAAVAEVNLGNTAAAPTGTGTTAAALVDVNLGNTAPEPPRERHHRGRPRRRQPRQHRHRNRHW